MSKNDYLKDFDICSLCKDSEGMPKNAYRTLEKAHTAINTVALYESLRLRAYWCPYGEGWHLTHK